MISYGDKMACHITDGPQTPDDDPCDGYSAVDEEDRAYEEARQQEIDDAIEAGDHLRDQRKDDALMSNTVKMFDYWAFHNDGTVQFFQICEGNISDYHEYDRVEDAPVVLIGEGPELRYHGRSYIAPRREDSLINVLEDIARG